MHNLAPNFWRSGNELFMAPFHKKGHNFHQANE